MKYTAKIKEAQLAGGVRLDPNGGEVTDAQAKAVASDPWGKKLIESGKLKFERAVEIPAKPRLGMTVANAVNGIAAPKAGSTRGKNKD